MKIAHRIQFSLLLLNGLMFFGVLIFYGMSPWLAALILVLFAALNWTFLSRKDSNAEEDSSRPVSSRNRWLWRAFLLVSIAAYVYWSISRMR
jgi:hypothetical protein